MDVMSRLKTLMKWIVLLPYYTAVWGVRIAWICTFGWLLAGLYLTVGFCLSPFGMAFTRYGGDATNRALNIWFLTPGKQRRR